MIHLEGGRLTAPSCARNQPFVPCTRQSSMHLAQSPCTHLLFLATASATMSLHTWRCASASFTISTCRQRTAQHITAHHDVVGQNCKKPYPCTLSAAHQRPSPFQPVDKRQMCSTAQHSTTDLHLTLCDAARHCGHVQRLLQQLTLELPAW
jgi:hypothetical protein